MADGEGDHGGRSRFGGSRSNARGPIAVAAVAGVLALAALGMASCGDRGNGVRFWQGGDNAAANSCPRPASMTGSEFNAQETGLRALRRAAFQNDFFAQLELGARYSAVKATDKNIEDPIESATWLAMALANDEGYAPINRVNRGGWGGWRPLSRYDDCRAFERHEAYRKLDRLLGSMTLDEQGAVRDRVTYILSTQDAEGYRTLARLHDGLYGPFGEPEDNREAREAWGRGNADRGQGRERNRRGYPAATSLFQRNDVDAYLYNYLAVQTGDVGAYVLMRDFERSAPSRAQYQRFVEVKARQWTPPFEFYPNTAPQSGVPFSDESRPRGDAYEYALGRMAGELPFIHVGRALRYLGVTETAAQRPEDLSKRQIETLEAMLGHPMEGRLSYLERVRAIQLAAVNGSSEAQLVLAVMYAEGIGLPADYARAFKWFEEAARQGSPEAKFAMSSYFALGVSGVADQDKAQAVAFRIDSALSGFGPSAGRLQAVLAQVSRSQRR